MVWWVKELAGSEGGAVRDEFLAASFRASVVVAVEGMNEVPVEGAERFGGNAVAEKFVSFVLINPFPEKEPMW